MRPAMRRAHSKVLTLFVSSFFVVVFGVSRCWPADRVPDKTVVLTLDDAVKSQIEFVAPLLEQLGFKATFFISQAWMNDADHFLSWTTSPISTGGGSRSAIIPGRMPRSIKRTRRQSLATNCRWSMTLLPASEFRNPSASPGPETISGPRPSNNCGGTESGWRVAACSPRYLWRGAGRAAARCHPE
jgi:hypothetical protein